MLLHQSLFSSHKPHLSLFRSFSKPKNTNRKVCSHYINVICHFKLISNCNKLHTTVGRLYMVKVRYFTPLWFHLLLCNKKMENGCRHSYPQWIRQNRIKIVRPFTFMYDVVFRLKSYFNFACNSREMIRDQQRTVNTSYFQFIYVEWLYFTCVELSIDCFYFHK